jgi:hypothetical protein
MVREIAAGEPLAIKDETTMTNENIDRLKRTWDMCLDERLSDAERMKSLDGVSFVIHYEEKARRVYLSDQFGNILTSAKAAYIWNAMKGFFFFYSDNAIKRHNDKVWDSLEENEQMANAPIPERPVDPSGYVYLLKAVGHNMYKVGMTQKEPSERILQFSPKLPFEVKLAGTIFCDNAAVMEKEVHDYYTANGERLNGEWFALSGANVAYFFDLKYAIEWKY